MKKERQIILTEGPILKSLTNLAMPIMASSFLSTVYSITDMAWIGLLGSKAVAGVGAAAMYLWLSQGFVSMARMGGQIYVAQNIGKGEKEKAGIYAHAAVWLTMIFAIIYAAVCLIFKEPLIGFFDLGDVETIADAIIYLEITCGLIIFSFLSRTLTGIYTAQGNSQIPFIANLIGVAGNLILDPILILGVGPFPRLEVAGAAWATIISQAITTVVLLVGVRKLPKEQNVLRGINYLKKPNNCYLKEVCKLGAPTAVQGTIYCGISMVLTRMISGFGPEAIAVQKVGGQIESITWNAADGFAAALNAFVAQNFGARKMDRVKKGYKITFWITGLWGALITVIFLLFPEQISKVFFHEEKAIATSIGYLVIVGLSEAFMCVELMTAGGLQGLGKTRESSIISVSLTVLRIPLAMVLGATSLGVEGVWWALTITSVMKGIAFYIAFKYYAKKMSGEV